MRVPLRWLAEWVELRATPEELASRLTFAGLEVDAIERTGPDLSALRVGEVLERAAHPAADRLSVCRVDVGEGEPLGIVCGAPNVAAGQKVAVARTGTTLPDGTRLKKAKIRGEVSMGMICSARELGLGDDHEGILVLDPSAPVGAPLDGVLEAGDAVLEIAITPNRGDCASILGIAREVRALFGGELRWPECAPPEAERPTSEDVRVEITDAEGCHVYCARVVRGLRVGESPAWVQERLVAAGMRPVNNVVDATNLVMLEVGQPLHAFDLELVRGGRIDVRAAQPGEHIETLDGVARTLEPEDLVIADGERAVAIAGVMGGANSEVHAGTTSILIESAHFHPRRVRRTARRLGLLSDASYRFERGVERDGQARAADRAARLVVELAGGEVSRGVVEARGSEPAGDAEIRLEPARVNRLLGTDLAPEQMVAMLRRLEIECAPDGDIIVCRSPRHRTDLALPADLAEEVARMLGYEQIPAAELVGELSEGAEPPLFALGRSVRIALEAEGLTEVATLPFSAPEDLDGLLLAPDDPRRATVRVLNPLQESDSQLRPTLAASLLRVARENLSRQVDELRVFEVARGFRRAGPEGALPEERLLACVLLTQASEPALWDARDGVPLFFVLKGIAERLLARLSRAGGFRASDAQPFLHPGAACEITASDRSVGWMGEIHPSVAAAFGIEPACALLELDLSALGELPTQKICYREVSRHPRVRRDLAVLLDRDQPAGEILEAIRKQAGALLASAEVFDRYEGRGVPEGKVSLAFRLVFQRADRTLTDAEVNKTTDRVVQMLAHRFGGELR